MSTSRVISYGVALLALAGCAASLPYSYGARLQEMSLQQLRRGETTKERVVALLGKPRDVIHGADGTQEWIYESVHVSGKFLTIFSSSPVNKQNVRRLRIVLDANGRLHDYTLDELYREVEPLVIPEATPPGGAVHQMSQQSSYSGSRR